MQSKIESGEYVLGEMIVPQTYKKVVLADDGTIKTELFSVSGRKIPLSEMRERVLKEHEDLGLIHAQTDEYYAALTQDQVNNRLAQLGESTNFSDTSNLSDAKEYLKYI